MDSFNATRCANSAVTTTCYAYFRRLVAVVAARHQRYLQDQGLAIDDCYHVTFRYANARLQLKPGLPHPLYEELRQCFIDSFN